MSGHRSWECSFFMPNRFERRAIKLLVERWDAVGNQFGRLKMPCARPNDGYQIFSLIAPQRTAGEIGFEIKPVVFNLPERANGEAVLFVVVRGKLYFDEAAIKQNVLRTLDFATEAAYFRKKADELEHVYGAHYDFARNEVGHPAFHAQMKSFAERFHQVTSAFEMTCTSKDLVDGVLRTVRLPSAQMDFFSFILQLCADHLIDKNSGPEELSAFRDLKSASAEIKGAAFLVPWLAKPAAQACLRANHWYS